MSKNSQGSAHEKHNQSQLAIIVPLYGPNRIHGKQNYFFAALYDDVWYVKYYISERFELLILNCIYFHTSRTVQSSWTIS